MKPQQKVPYFLFILLYFIQGAALAYYLSFQKRYLDSAGISAVRIGTLTSLCLLPFILKPFLGFLSDRYPLKKSGERKPYLRLGLFVAAFSFALASTLDPAHQFYLFSTTVISASFGVALFDAVIDAIAVEISQESEQGKIQSSMLAGKASGMVLLSTIFGFIIDSGGYFWVFSSLTLFMFVPFFFLHRIKEDRSRLEAFQWRAFLAFTEKQNIVLCLFAILYSFASFGTNGLFAYYFSKHFMVEAKTVGYFESLRSMGAVAGAGLFAWLSSRIDLKKMGLGFLIAAFLFSLAFYSFVEVSSFMKIAVFWGALWALRESFYLTVAMSQTRVAIAGSMFGIFMAFSNIGTSLGEGLATGWTAQWGFNNTFLILGLLNLLIIPVLYYYFRLRKISSEASNLSTSSSIESPSTL